MLAAGFGFMLNGFELRIFGTTGMVFGQIFALVTAATFGPWRGGLVAAFAMIPTWVRWGHPFGLLLLGMESLAIGWLLARRQRDVLRASLLYWLTIGLPLTVFIVVCVLRIASPGHVVISIVYLVNAMIVAVVAKLALDAPLLHRLLGQLVPVRLATETLHARLARHLIITTVLPLIALGLWFGSSVNQRALAFEREVLSTAAREAAVEIEDHLLHHRIALGLVASGLSRSGEVPIEARIEEELCQQGLGFRRVLAVSPSVASTMESGTGLAGRIVLWDGIHLREEDAPDGVGRSWVQIDPHTGRSIALAFGETATDAAGRRTTLVGLLD